MECEQLADPRLSLLGNIIRPRAYTGDIRGHKIVRFRSSRKAFLAVGMAYGSHSWGADGNLSFSPAHIAGPRTRALLKIYHIHIISFLSLNPSPLGKVAQEAVKVLCLLIPVIKVTGIRRLVGCRYLLDGIQQGGVRIPEDVKGGLQVVVGLPQIQEGNQNAHALANSGKHIRLGHPHQALSGFRTGQILFISGKRRIILFVHVKAHDTVAVSNQRYRAVIVGPPDIVSKLAKLVKKAAQVVRLSLQVSESHPKLIGVLFVAVQGVQECVVILVRKPVNIGTCLLNRLQFLYQIFITHRGQRGPLAAHIPGPPGSGRAHVSASAFVKAFRYRL